MVKKISFAEKLRKGKTGKKVSLLFISLKENRQLLGAEILGDSHLKVTGMLVGKLKLNPFKGDQYGCGSH